MKTGFLTLLLMIHISCFSQEMFQVNAFSIKIPKRENLDRFLAFVEDDLATRGVNTLLLRVDYGYEYKSHSELIGDDALNVSEIKKIVATCKDNQIKIVPQINLLGHQSWHSTASKLLQVYPEFDETPHIKLPEEYKWPNEDGLYCKSYCPLHPKVHDVVFDLVDEIVDVFEAEDFHAGMDEVFYLASDQCPRCKGKDPAVLFANEVTKIRDHLAKSGKRLWIWGDRLIDGESTGIGIWEASGNDTETAIDLIPKDVVICDWHYERADPTAAMFAMKGFDVITCTWRKPKVAAEQIKLMTMFINQATEQMKPRYLGMMHTVWSPANSFLDDFYENGEKEEIVQTFEVLFPKSEISKQNSPVSQDAQ